MLRGCLVTWFCDGSGPGLGFLVWSRIKINASYCPAIISTTFVQSSLFLNIFDVLAAELRPVSPGPPQNPDVTRLP